MEISKSTDLSIRIKTKNATVAVDPTGKGEADIVILTAFGDDGGVPENTKLVVDGPGEYEVGGISVKGERLGESVSYTIFDDQYKVLLTAQASVSKVREEDDVDAVVIQVTAPITKKDVSTLSCDVVLLYGKQEYVPSEEGIIKLTKVNLKKKEEVKGNIVYLGG